LHQYAIWGMDIFPISEYCQPVILHK